MPKCNWRAIAMVAVVSLLCVAPAVAQIMINGGAIVPTLKQQLVFGLLARTPDEKAFINQVVEKVDTGDLPLSLVQSTFLWARNKRPYPMPFFERGLKVRAARVGIDL